MDSYRLFRLFGIDVLVHWSWLAIFALLTWWLAQGFFKDEYGDWTTGQRWGAAVTAALAFFASNLLHELAHSLMAKREGLPVKSITLFIFGGVSALGSARVRRGGLWARGRNLLTATRRASMAGTFIAFGLIAVGVVSILAGNFIGGAWFIVIGWFLPTVSEASFHQLLFRST